MTARVEFSLRALDQLEVLYRYIESAASPEIAARYTYAVVDFCQSLQTFPMRGTQRDDIRPGIRITNYRKRTVIAFVADVVGDLYKQLKLKDGEGDPEFLAKVIYGGHYWAPKWEMPRAFHDHVDHPRDVKHVVDVLDMWSFIEEAYAKFTVEQREQIAEDVGPLGSHVAFHGFDGNHESSQLGIALFLIEEMERFQRFKGRALNSHHPTYERYLGMVDLFEVMRAKLIGHGLSVQQVITLLKV
jgi:uncharacterized protein